MSFKTLYSDCTLLTVHGVFSDNSGLANLRNYCKEKLPGLEVENYYWGNYLPLVDIDEKTAQSIFGGVRDKMELVYWKHQKSDKRKIYIVAHSFGTLAVIKALEMGIPNLKIEALILFGSIVKRSQYWDGWIGVGVLSDAPFAVIRPRDSIVKGARFVGGEPSGALGFIANGSNVPLQTFKNGGHTAYDPHDQDDVVKVIKQGFGGVSLIDRDQWRSNLGLIKRIWYGEW